MLSEPQRDVSTANIGKQHLPAATNWHRQLDQSRLPQKLEQHDAAEAQKTRIADLEPRAHVLCDVILADLQHDVLPGALPDIHQHVGVAVFGQLQGGGGEAWGRMWALILAPKLLIKCPLA